MTRKETLERAAECVCTQREQDYGAPENKSLRSDLARVTAERDAAEKEITRLKAIMREKGIFTIPAKYPWEKPEWNW